MGSFVLCGERMERFLLKCGWTMPKGEDVATVADVAQQEEMDQQEQEEGEGRQKNIVLTKRAVSDKNNKNQRRQTYSHLERCNQMPATGRCQLVCSICRLC